MHVRVEITDRSAVCRPVGALDSDAAPQFREAMALMASVPRLVIDLSDVPFMDSAALSALVAGIRRVRDEGGDVAVCSSRRHISRVLEMVGLDRVVAIAGTVDEAERMLTTERSRPFIGVT